MTSTEVSGTDKSVGPLEENFARYSGQGKPLGPYAALAGAFSAAFAGSLAAARRYRGGLPEAVGAGDLALIGIATFQLSRLITKEEVLSFLRAPFTEYEDNSGIGEVEEKARGEGLQKAIGELLTCPFCLGLWVSGGFVGGLAITPRVTRLVAASLTAKTISDAFHIAYDKAKETVT